MSKRIKEGLIVKPPFYALFFYEIDCPICRYVKYHVMLPLQLEGHIIVRPIEVLANSSSPDTAWFHYYSEMSGGEITPTIKLVDRYLDGFRWREDTIQDLHLWERKDEEVTESDVETADRLRDQIIEAIEKYRRKPTRMTHQREIAFRPIREGFKLVGV